MNVLEMIASRLRIERKRNGWSQIYVASLLELGRNTTYSNWERGKKMPNAETILKLAELFRVSVDYLVGRTEKRNFDLTEKEIHYERVLSLSEEEVLNTYKFVIDDQELSDEQVKRLIAYVRAERSIKDKS